MTAPAQSPRETDRHAYHDYRRWAAALRTDADAAEGTAENILVDSERHGPLAKTVAVRKAAVYERLASDMREAAEQYEQIAADLRLHLIGERP